MRLSCDVEMLSRGLASYGMRAKTKPIRSSISIGRRPGASSSKEGLIFLLVCTAKDRNGTKFKLKGNVEQIFGKFVQNGKATIRLKEPAKDICISKADPLQLKNILSVIKLGHLDRNCDLEKIHLTTLNPAKTSQVERLPTKMVVHSRKDYPVTTNFPKTLESLQIMHCKLKKVDSRILELRNLKCLDLSNNNLAKLPDSVGRLNQLAELKLANNQLDRIPLGLLNSSLKHSLQALDLSGNQFKMLPSQLTEFTNLVHLKVNDNQLLCLPWNMGQLTRLKFFWAGNNKLQFLPYSFTRLALEEVDMFGNGFQGSGMFPSTQDEGYFPSFVEIAARAVKKYRLMYTERDLPRILIQYLGLAKWCLCGKPCFQPYAQHCSQFSLHRVAHTVAGLDSAGSTTAPVQGFLCSKDCWQRLQSNPNAVWKCSRR
ncbi:leucine-rich repeat protein 1-like [Amphiura filiformis]|uniref:leucine-rich repeat protein 1-like n=1 Tax=Amphiura filiformis TaxID=82378 RepID=UPI003B214151